MTKPKLFTVAKLADFLQLSHAQVYRLIKDKGLTAYRVSGEWYIYEKDVAEFYSRPDISTRAKNKYKAALERSAV